MRRRECVNCNKRLSWLARMRNLNFCTPEHKNRYEVAIQEQMLARLFVQRKRLGLPTDSLMTVGTWISEGRRSPIPSALFADPGETTD